MLPMVRDAHHEVNPLKALNLILSLAKDEGGVPRFLSSPNAASSARGVSRRLLGRGRCP